MEQSVRKVDIKGVCFLAAFNILAFQMYLASNVSTVFNYADEAVFLAIIFFACRYHWLSKGGKGVGTVLLLLAALLLDGLIGNLINPYPQLASSVVVDVFTCVKFFILAIALMGCADGPRLPGGSLPIIFDEAKILCLLMATTSVVSLFFNIGMSSGEVRYGLRGYRFVFEHPEIVNLLCVGLSIVFCADLKRNLSWLLLMQVPVLLTLRSKSFAFVAILGVIVLSVKNKTVARKMFIPTIVLVVAIACLSIHHYYADQAQARTRLMMGAVQIAGDSFPFGLGFGSYGSAVTATASGYPEVYDALGFSAVYGLSRVYPAFVSDTFWPIILGQFGWLGLAIVCLLVIALLVKLLDKIRSTASEGYAVGAVLLIAYLAISSMAGSAIFAPMSIYLLLCLHVNYCHQNA